MSTDWSKYATTDQTQQRARSPADNAVIEFGVGAVRAIPHQRVGHNPTVDNRAHADVWGPKRFDPEVRRRFSRILRMAIPLPTV